MLFGDSFPWSMFLVVAAAGSWRRWRAGEAMAPPQRIRTLLLLWIVAFVVFFSASAAKQDLYIFPIVPAVAALAGVMVAGATAGLRWTALTIGVVVAVAGAGVLHLFGPGASVYALRGALAMGIAALAGGLIVSAFAAANRTRASLLVVVLTFIVLDWVFVVRVLPDFERFKPVPGFAQTLSPRLQPDDALITYDEALPSLVFYLRRHVDPYFLPEEVFDRFRSGRTVYAILSNENYAEIGPQIGVPTCVDRAPADLRREAEEHVEQGSAAGAGADYEQVRRQIPAQLPSSNHSRIPNPTNRNSRTSPMRRPTIQRGSSASATAVVSECFGSWDLGVVGIRDLELGISLQLFDADRRRARTFPTTMPAARLARRAASSSVPPAARASAMVPITVSPAPVTSDTSRASAGSAVSPSGVCSHIPCSPRVISTFSQPDAFAEPARRLARVVFGCESACARPLRPRGGSGVISVAPR